MGGGRERGIYSFWDRFARNHIYYPNYAFVSLFFISAYYVTIITFFVLVINVMKTVEQAFSYQTNQRCNNTGCYIGRSFTFIGFNTIADLESACLSTVAPKFLNGKQIKERGKSDNVT